MRAQPIPPPNVHVGGTTLATCRIVRPGGHDETCAVCAVSARRDGCASRREKAKARLRSSRRSLLLRGSRRDDHLRVLRSAVSLLAARYREKILSNRTAP